MMMRWTVVHLVQPGIWACFSCFFLSRNGGLFLVGPVSAGTSRQRDMAICRVYMFGVSRARQLLRQIAYLTLIYSTATAAAAYRQLVVLLCLVSIVA